MSLKQTAIKLFSSHIKNLNSMAVSPEEDDYYDKLIKIYTTALDALITVQEQEKYIENLKENENQALFIKTILNKFINKLEEKHSLRCSDTYEIIFLERDIQAVLKEMEIEL